MMADSGIFPGIPNDWLLQIAPYVCAPPIGFLVALVVRRKFLSGKALVIENAISSAYKTLQSRYGKKSSYGVEEVSTAIAQSGKPETLLKRYEIYVYQMYMNRREFERHFPIAAEQYAKRRSEILTFVADYESMASVWSRDLLGDVEAAAPRFHWFNFRKERVIAFIRHLDGHMRLLLESRYGKKPTYFKYEVDACLPKTKEIGRYLALAYGEYLSEKDYQDNNGSKWPAYSVVNDELDQMREKMAAFSFREPK